MNALRVRLLILSFLGVFLCQAIFAQNSKEREEKDRRMLAAKKEFISSRLDLSEKESSVFLPLYQDYLKTRMELYHRGRKVHKNMENLDEQEAKERLKEHIKLKREDIVQYESFVSELEGVLPAQKILQLERLEREFNRSAIKSVRKRKSRMKKDGYRP